ncbi:MAG: hypothetical protein V2I43_00250, partial [Parvularcula sp.]|nr:hypothetical protein [Parvularcula sp.]
IGLDPAHLRVAQQPQLGHQRRLLCVALEAIDCRQRKWSKTREPRRGAKQDVFTFLVAVLVQTI